MRRESCRVELLRLLAEMPFLDRQDMAAVSGRSTGSVYESVRMLEDWRLVSSFSHGSETTSHHGEVLPDGGRDCVNSRIGGA